MWTQRALPCAAQYAPSTPFAYRRSEAPSASSAPHSASRWQQYSRRSAADSAGLPAHAGGRGSEAFHSAGGRDEKSPCSGPQHNRGCASSIARSRVVPEWPQPTTKMGGTLPEAAAVASAVDGGAACVDFGSTIRRTAAKSGIAQLHDDAFHWNRVVTPSWPREALPQPKPQSQVRFLQAL